MSVLYSTINFRKNLNRGAGVSQGDDVTYAQVRIRDSAPPPAGNSDAPAALLTKPALYSTVGFKKGSNHGPAVSQDDDATYAEVRHSAPPPAGNHNKAAEYAGCSSHPYRLAAVCLGLLCVLLLTAIIALCVHDSEDHSILSQRFSVIESDMEELQRNYSTVTEEKAKLEENNITLNEEIERLQENNITLTEEMVKLRRNIYTLKEETEELQKINRSLTEENRKLVNTMNNIHSALAKLQFLQKYCNSQSGVLVCDSCPEGWKLWRSKCYYFSTGQKSWTESRYNCLQQGADLVIIESKEEQDFIRKATHYTTWGVWIGLRYTERKWLWVDGSPLKEGFWANNQPNKNYVYVHCTGSGKWYTGSNNGKQWICETEALSTSLVTFLARNEMDYSVPL